MSTHGNLILYAVYTLASVAGLVFIKAAFPAFLAARSGGSIAWLPLTQLGIGAMLYVGSFGIWMVILSQNSLSTAYPIAIGLTLCFSTLVAYFYLDETIGISKLSGICLIFIGIYMIFKEQS